MHAEIMLSITRTIRYGGVPLAAGLLLAVSAHANVWRFAPLEPQLPENNSFRDSFVERSVSVSTAINDRGNQYGWYRLPDGTTWSYNLLFADNPEFTSVARDDFVPLSAGERECFSFFCGTEPPFGIALEDNEAFSAWFNTASGTSPLPDSLPFSRFPGQFVSENGEGVVASTQVTGQGQFSAIMNDELQPLILLEDVPWVVALSSGKEPLVLGYRGNDGDCLVYGRDCEPPPCENEDGDRHHNTHGRGHREHGRGHGYGHDKHHCEHDHDGIQKATTTSRDHEGPVLIRARTDNSTRVWSLPRHLGGSGQQGLARERFPLTMNDERIMLRATVEREGDTYRNRLLQCRLPVEIDIDDDGIVDCVDGLRPLIPLARATPVDTVLGFSLNDQGQLIGNYGFNAAGIGEPFFVDTRADEPVSQALQNRSSDHRNWELNVVTDINADGMAVGYGHRDCSPSPDAYTLYPDTDTNASRLQFDPVVQPENAAVKPGQRFTPLVHASGGSGEYQYRMNSKRPEDNDWQPVHDWRSRPGSYHSRDDHEGDVCLRVRVRDQAAPETTASTVIRVRVSEAPEEADDGADETDVMQDREIGDALDMVRVGAPNSLLLTVLAITGLIRRRAR